MDLQRMSSMQAAPSPGGMDYKREQSELDVLVERKKLVEKEKAQHNWLILQRTIRNTIEAVSMADVKEIYLSHGMHPERKLNHPSIIQHSIYVPEREEYVTTDGNYIRTFMSDGRKKDIIVPEESVNRLLYASESRVFIGWVHCSEEIHLMNSDFEVVSSSKAPSDVCIVQYNHNTNEVVTMGPGYLTSWSFRYGARHLIPRKTTKTDSALELCSHMVMEDTASRSQKCYCAAGTDVVVYNLFDGSVVCQRKDVHVRPITALTFFNPLKYLITGAKDGTIKIWDNTWHVKQVFVGHSDAVNVLTIYPFGPSILSASHDCTLRVWNLETCDEVDRVKIEEPVEDLGALISHDRFFTQVGDTVTLWKIQHLHHSHTSVGHRVISLKHTDHPSFPIRSLLLCRDGAVRIISPPTGDVLTTLLLNPRPVLVDAAYAVAENTLFTVDKTGDIVKAMTNTNPCTKVAMWPCSDPNEACNYLLVYEYVVDMMMGQDSWSAMSRGIATQSIKAALDNPQKNCNRTLLLGGRKDGYICVFNWDTGEVEFKIEAHGSKGVLSMVANSKADQLISAGADNIIKVWRLYPFAEEALTPLMSFYCAHLPIHMTVIKTKLCAAFQDHSSATYSIVLYNLQDKNRFDHKPDDDHFDAITSLSSCSRMKLYASASLDGTVRIWNDANKLVRLLKLNTTPFCVDFCSKRGDLLVGIGNHLHIIPYTAYMPNVYRLRMVSMKFREQTVDPPVDYDENVVNKLSRSDVQRLKNAHAAFKYTEFVDKLSDEEVDEVTREQKQREQIFSLLEAREQELRLIRDGELKSKRKPKKTAQTEKDAFNKYMKMYYDKPRPQLPEEDLYPEDTLKDMLTGEKRMKTAEKPWKPKKDVAGFFPPPSTAQSMKPGAPLDPPYFNANGFIPNSVLVKLLWPPEVKQELMKKHYVPPNITAAQLAQIEEQQEDLTPQNSKSNISLSRKDTEEYTSRVLIMDDYEDEMTPPCTPDKMDDSMSKLSSKSTDMRISKVSSPIEQTPESSIMNKFKEILSSPSTQEDDDDDFIDQRSEISSVHSMKAVTDSVKVASPDRIKVLSPHPPIKKREVRPTKPITKFIAKVPPKPKSPTPPSSPEAEIPMEIPRSPTPPPPPTPLPDFIMQFKGVEWFENFFPLCNEITFPKPWTPNAFATILMRVLKTAEYAYKTAIAESLMQLHSQESLYDSTGIMKTFVGILNSRTDAPSCAIENQKWFILYCLKALQHLGMKDRDYITELMLQYLDGDREVRKFVIDTFHSVGLHDPHSFFSKELDGWDIWSISESNRKVDLRRICQQWLERWITSFKLHVKDTVDRIKKGQNVQGRLSRASTQKTPSRSSQNKSILRKQADDSAASSHSNSSPGEGRQLMHSGRSYTVMFNTPPDQSMIDNATYMEAINYFCEIAYDKEVSSLRQSLEPMVELPTQNKNTVLVMPKPASKPVLVRLGEMHTSTCRPHRETAYHIDFRLPPVTSRGHQPIPGQLDGFAPCINLPMKTIYMNPFHSEIDEYDLRLQEPILITLKSAQKYFIPSLSYVPPETVVQ